MRRRSFLQALISLPLAGKAAWSERTRLEIKQRVTYSDSNGNTATALTVLADSITTTGGIVYQG